MIFRNLIYGIVFGNGNVGKEGVFGGAGNVPKKRSFLGINVAYRGGQENAGENPTRQKFQTFFEQNLQLVNY